MNRKSAGYSFCAILLANLLIGCAIATSHVSNSNSPNQETTDMMQGMKNTTELTIDLSTDPSTVHVGDKVHLIEHVSNQKKDIVDASVAMEIWLADETKHDKVNATPDAKGNYIVNYVFKQSGTYHLTIHTTTDDLHQMPTKNIQVLQ